MSRKIWSHMVPGFLLLLEKITKKKNLMIVDLIFDFLSVASTAISIYFLNVTFFETI